MARQYKSVSLKPDTVKVQHVQVLPPQMIGDKQMVQLITSDQHEQYGLMITTNDKRTFNRLIKRLGR